MDLSASFRRMRGFFAPIWAIALLNLVFAPSAAWANPNPDFSEIRHGDIEFDIADDHLQIIQKSGVAIIEWDQFSIDEGEITSFTQPGGSARVLNRVLESRSNIDGTLKANGGVVLVNSNGIQFGANSVVDTGSFIASTLDISDDDFMNGGSMNFTGGSAEAIVNLGKVSARDGDAILIAAQVRNSGQLLAPNGLAGVAAGSDVLLQESGDERLFVRAGTGDIVNDATGEIAGQVAELKAGGNVYGLAIQQHGRVAATGAVNEGGQIFLRANGGKIVNTTPVAADKVVVDGGVGGDVELTETSALSGNQVTVQTDGGTITNMGSISAAADGVAPGVVDINAGDLGDVVLGATSVTSGDLVSVSSVGGDIVHQGQLRAAEGAIAIDAGLGGSVQLAMDSETSAADISVSAAGGSILSAGHVVGNDGGDVRFDASDGGDIVVPLGGLIEAGSVEMKSAGGSIDHAGTIIAQTIDGKGGRVNLDVSPGGSITIQTSGIIEGGEVNVLAGGGSIEHSGIIKARDGEGNGGTVNMDAGDGGTVDVYGVIDAAGENGVGGTVTVTGSEVTIRAGALIDASGRDGGGAINIGGGFGGNDPNIRNANNTTVEAGAVLRADATSDGPGGNVVVWANGTTNFAGTISARGAGSGVGGNAEVSGLENLNFVGNVDLGSESGVGGNLLLDPGDFTIDGSNAAAITSALANNTNVTVTTNAATAGDGDVLVDVPLAVNSANQGVFSILAHRHIYVNELIQLQGDGGAVNLIAGWDGSTGYSPIPAPGIASPVNVPNMPDFPNSGGFGNNQGSVFIGNNMSTNPVWVGTRNGPTAILGYDLVVTAAADSHAGVGYVGSASASASGDISVDVLNDIIMNSADDIDGRTRIGHELTSTDATVDGRIFVNAGRDIAVNSALNPDAIAAIGHYVPNGSVSAKMAMVDGHPGDLEVRAGRDLTVTSGGADAFIGNYARDNDADISVEVRRDITLDATNGKVFIGHNDGGVASPTAKGGISVRANRQLDLIDGTTSQWKIGHNSRSGTTESPLAIGIGSLGASGIFTVDQEFADRVILPAINHGSVSIAAIGSPAGPAGVLTTQSAALAYNSENDLNLLATSVLALGAISNGSTTGGGVNGVAGWDSNTGFPGPAGPEPAGPGEFDPALLAADATSFGRNGDVLEVGGAISTAAGDINLFGGNISVSAAIDPGTQSTNLRLGARRGGIVKFDGAPVLNATIFGGSTNDTVVGPNQDINFVIDQDNGGSLAGLSALASELPPGAAAFYRAVFPQVNFQGIENLTGGSQDDAFTFLNQAQLTGAVHGGGGSNSLFIDDTGLTGNHFYVISNRGVRRNPTYDFAGIESLALQTGSGDNKISTSFFSFQQSLKGGSGSNILGVLVPDGVGKVGPGSPLLPPDGLGLGGIAFSGMNALVLSRPTAEGTIKTRVVDRTAPEIRTRPMDGIRVRDLEQIPDTEGMLLADIQPIIAQQNADAANQANSDSGDSPANPNPGIGPQTNPAPQNNAPPGQSQDVQNNDGPVEMDGGGSRTSVNMPPAVQQRFNDMFNPGDWQGTGLNFTD